MEKFLQFRLYHTPFCGYCHRVRDAADALGIPLQLVNVATNSNAYLMLLEKRGKGTVPVLGILDSTNTEKLMGESADIIQFLQEYQEARDS